MTEEASTPVESTESTENTESTSTEVLESREPEKSADELRKEAMRIANRRPRGPGGRFLKAGEAPADAKAEAVRKAPPADLKPYDFDKNQTLEEELISYKHDDAIAHFACDPLESIRPKKYGSLRIVELNAFTKAAENGFALVSDTANTAFSPSRGDTDCGNGVYVMDGFSNILAVRTRDGVTYNSGDTRVSEFLKRREDESNGRNYVQARLEAHGGYGLPFAEAAVASGERFAPFIAKIVSKAGDEKLLVRSPDFFSGRIGWRNSMDTLSVRHFQGAAVYLIGEHAFLFDVDRKDIDFGVFNGFFSEIEPYGHETRQEMIERVSGDDGVGQAYNRMRPRRNEWEREAIHERQPTSETEDTWYSLRGVKRQGELFFFPIERKDMKELLFRYGLTKVSVYGCMNIPKDVLFEELDRRSPVIDLASGIMAMFDANRLRLGALNYVYNAWLADELAGPEGESMLKAASMNAVDAKNPLDRAAYRRLQRDDRFEAYDRLIGLTIDRFNSFLAKNGILSKCVRNIKFMPQPLDTLGSLARSDARWLEEGLDVVRNTENLMLSIARRCGLMETAAEAFEHTGSKCSVSNYRRSDRYDPQFGTDYDMLFVNGKYIRYGNAMTFESKFSSHPIGSLDLCHSNLSFGGEVHDQESTRLLRDTMCRLPLGEARSRFGKSAASAIVTTLGNLDYHGMLSNTNPPNNILHRYDRWLQLAGSAGIARFEVFDKNGDVVDVLKVDADNRFIKLTRPRRMESIGEAVMAAVISNALNQKELGPVKAGLVNYDLGQHVVGEAIPLINRRNCLALYPPTRIPKSVVDALYAKGALLKNELNEGRFSDEFEGEKYDMGREDVMKDAVAVRLLMMVYGRRSDTTARWLDALPDDTATAISLRTGTKPDSDSCHERISLTFAPGGDVGDPERSTCYYRTVRDNLYVAASNEPKDDENNNDHDSNPDGSKVELAPIMLVRGVVRHERGEHVPLLLDDWHVVLTNSSNRNYNTRGYID